MNVPSIAKRLGLSSALIAACALTAPLASANMDFPTLLKANVPMTCLPHCTLCHNTDLGGPGNIRPGSMGQTWTMYGLDGNVVGTLVPALNAAKAALQDTDADGIPDVMELADGTDPDVAGPTAPLICNAMGGSAISSPSYGCGGSRVARQGPVDNVAAVAGAMVALIGLTAIKRRAVSKRRP